MNRILSGSCLLFLLIFGLSCSKTKEKLTEFDIDYTNTLTVPASSYTVDVPAEFLTPEIPTESESKFSAQKTAKDHIDEIKMTRFNISVSSGDLSVLKSIDIYLKSTGQSDILIATKSNIGAGVTSTSADLKDVNIKNYIFNDKIQFKVRLLIGGGSSFNQQIKMDQTIHVKAKLIK